MANSLRAKLSKLRHDGHITDAEYQAFIKKLDGHDREIRNKAIDEFAERLKEKAEGIMQNPDIMLDCKKCTIWKVKDIDEIAEEMKGGAE